MTFCLYAGFILFIVFALMFDLFVANRKAHVIHMGEALGWSAFWASLGMAFAILVYYAYEYQWMGLGVITGLNGHQAAMQYVTGYLIEESLSVDNMVVIAMVFTYFKVPRIYQHRVLFWGILGAIVMRGLMIAAGTALLHRFDWIIYVFGLLLLFSAVRLLTSKDEEIEPDKSVIVRLARRFYPVTNTYSESHFFVRENNCWAMTPLFLVLLVVESTDVLFAVDSIPAVLAVTTDPFLVFTSNVFAILGLRSLFFALAGLIHRFRYLQVSLVILLGFVGIKMLLTYYVHISTQISLLVIATLILGGVVASLLVGEKSEK